MHKRLASLLLAIPAIFLLSSCAHHLPHIGTSISGIINRYTAVTAIDSCSGLTVDDASAFLPGDLVMIIQMQGASINGTNTPSYGEVTALNSAGLYELGRVGWVFGNTIQLQHKLVNHYSTSGHVQIVTVPEYHNVKIDGPLTCSAWNGSVGGILAFHASGAVIMAADINVKAKGFRGGTVFEQTQLIPTYEGDFVSTEVEKYAAKGEGIAGFGQTPQLLGRGGPANGGGGGANHNAGGGGGANAGCGGNGGYAYQHPRYSGNYKVAQGLGGHPLAGMHGRLFWEVVVALVIRIMEPVLMVEEEEVSYSYRLLELSVMALQSMPVEHQHRRPTMMAQAVAVPAGPLHSTLLMPV